MIFGAVAQKVEQMKRVTRPVESADRHPGRWWKYGDRAGSHTGNKVAGSSPAGAAPSDQVSPEPKP